MRKTIDTSRIRSSESDSAKTNRISQQADSINTTEDLSGKGELGTFRLASSHRDYGLKSEASNVVSADLRIRFISKTKSGFPAQRIEHVIPVMVTHDSGSDIKAYYSGLDVDEGDFLRFYRSVVPTVSSINRQSHYHSEPFLAYFLQSSQGARFLQQEFEKKGLITKSSDGVVESNVASIDSISLDLHSTKVICFNCSPFLDRAKTGILRSINNSLFLSRDQEVGDLTYNVSATDNFNSSNLTGLRTFPHIPVLEQKTSNILTRTEVKLGEDGTSLQKTGGLQRTFFLSGSKSLGSVKIQAIATDKEKWDKIKNDAALKIQEAWKSYRDDKREMAELEAEFEERAGISSKAAASDSKLSSIAKRSQSKSEQVKKEREDKGKKSSGRF